MIKEIELVTYKAVGAIALFIVATTANADGLKVFGPEFCTPYTAGTCINFYSKNLKDAKTWSGDYKYPNGRKAYDECARNSDQTDGGLAYCSMVFHREEQSPSKRAEMCHRSVREKYRSTVSGDYPVTLYDSVWGCGKN